MFARSKNSTRKGKTCDLLYMKEKTVVEVHKYSEKATPLERGEKEETRMAIGTHAYRRTENDSMKSRGFSEITKTKSKQNNLNAMKRFCLCSL